MKCYKAKILSSFIPLPMDKSIDKELIKDSLRGIELVFTDIMSKEELRHIIDMQIDKVRDDLFNECVKCLKEIEK